MALTYDDLPPQIVLRLQGPVKDRPLTYTLYLRPDTENNHAWVYTTPKSVEIEVKAPIAVYIAKARAGAKNHAHSPPPKNPK